MNERNYGIDLLRIISMCFVIILHFFGHGGVLATIEPGSLNYYVSWLLETIAYSGVGIFATISGFVGFSVEKKSHRASRFFRLWLQVVFYSVVLTIIIAIAFKDSVETIEILKSFFPIATDAYWYFTAYALLYLLMPWINMVIEKSDKKRVWVVLFSSFIFLLFSNTLVGLHELSILVFYYLLGGITKKHNLIAKIRMRQAGVLLFLLLLSTWLWKIVISKYNNTLSSLLLRYDSPSIILISMCFVIIFAKIQVTERMKKIITMVASSTFAVYLLNDHPLVKTHLIKNRFVFLQNQSVLELIFIIIGGSILFFFISIIIDKVRELIFLKCCVKKLSEKSEALYLLLCSRCGTVLENIYDKLMKE